ncbi:DEAD/DEAH box helicase [Campylobacter fetus]|uniref:DEAD-box ATP-dependent RNA helicase RhpA n=1 Tax=Campylobacter fetus TaxID=196 RepID=A0A5L8JML8_CAMFE|nr:DEAD/DEAH box helicase [Campylobacter fetus]EAI5407988.1 DEAD/DEAH box helicase [Campylobacter fetus]EAJ0327818.1 DEAD/DEAH box helicase [Campylobacter fetus]EAJ1229862.1 DEAD/DEAH box helicase [Campylobacter fetus]EAK0434459.1 DEAD/DEAH box helicase [Campylobacter fetus]EAK0468227.1 DEAD/DEAH box helicase [Campylobacter fetus]
MLFSDFDLSSAILEALKELNYDAPTQIQQVAIPAIMQGKDILAGARTGTGKTAAFALPILEKLSSKERNKKRPQTRVLVLVPTRELANQVTQNIKSYAKKLPFKTLPVFGGVSSYPQIQALKSGIDIVVATPGRLLDLALQNALSLEHIDTLVFDEADRMFDMGFIHDIKQIVKMLPEKRQNLLFSATYPSEVMSLCNSMLKDPLRIQIEEQNSTALNIIQRVILVDRDKKMELLNEVFGVESIDQALVFTRTKRSADKCSSYLHTLGFSVAALHGDKSQSVRSKTLEKFKNGKTKILVATDIAARGLDIKELPFVINLELPNVPEDYVHRIGRTGRAGNDGVAISLVCVDEFKFLIDIEKLIDKKLIRESFSGFEADLRVKPQPIRRGQNMNKSSERDDRNGNKIDKKERKPREFNSDKKDESKRGRNRDDFKGEFRDRPKKDGDFKRKFKKDESKREYRIDGVKSEFSKDKKEFSKNSRAKDSNSSFDGEAKREFKFKKDDKKFGEKKKSFGDKKSFDDKDKKFSGEKKFSSDKKPRSSDKSSDEKYSGNKFSPKKKFGSDKPDRGDKFTKDAPKPRASSRPRKPQSDKKSTTK